MRVTSRLWKEDTDKSGKEEEEEEEKKRGDKSGLEREEKREEEEKGATSRVWNKGRFYCFDSFA